MKTPMVQVVRSETTNPVFAEAFAAGCGGRIVERYESGPWAGFGSPVSWGDMQRAIAAGEPWYYGDKPYFGRGAYIFRVTRNAFQHAGVGTPAFDRLFLFGVPKPQPFRRTGTHVVVCAQSDFWHRTHSGMTQAEWSDATVAEVRRYTDRPITVRTKVTTHPLHDDLRRAYCVVVWSSNCAVDALLAGVPVVTLGSCAASAMGVSSLADIENLKYPSVGERSEWAAVLVANQWTRDELRSGACWRALQEAT